MNVKKLLAQIAGEDIAKGVITPESLSLGGVLETEIAIKFIDLVRDQSEFLKAITVKKPGKIKGSFKLYDVNQRQMVRVAQGNEPTAGQLAEHRRIDVNYTNLSGQIFFTLTFDDLRDNQNNPNFESEMEAMFAKTFANELALLGFEGIADDYAGSAWARLNKGWNQVAKEDVPVGQIVNINGVASICTRFDSMIDVMPSKYLIEDVTTFVVSARDYRSWVKEMYADGHDVLALSKVSGKVPAYMGFPVRPVTQAVTGEHTFTQIQNFWMTVLTEIERYREVSGRKRCIDYTFDKSSDYGFGNPEAVVFAYDDESGS